MPEEMDVRAIYDGSDADRTRALYAALGAIGPCGIVAMNVLRACKASERAKKYRGGNGHGSYRAQAYEKKRWSVQQLIDVLREHADGLGAEWGWGRDEKTRGFEHVFYVELPGAGQVSFHMESRYDGPDYTKPWDNRDASYRRAIRYADCIIRTGAQPPAWVKLEENEDVTRNDRTEGEGAAGDAGAQPAAQQEALDL